VPGPNSDTLYGGGWTDLGTTPAAITFPTAENSDTNHMRYASVLAQDIYGNVHFVLHRTDFPARQNESAPGFTNKICLFWDSPQNPARAGHNAACSGATFKAKRGVSQRHLFLVVRVFSTAEIQQGCIDAGTVAANPTNPTLWKFFPGFDGCNIIEGINASPVIAGTQVRDPFTDYQAYMAPSATGAPNPATCSYVFQHAPCFGGDKNAFWNAVCKALEQSPPRTDEASYIDTYFCEETGICSTGCRKNANGQYDLDYFTLTKKMDETWAKLAPAESTIGVNDWQKSNQWVVLPFDGHWVASADAFASRANAAPAIPTNDAVYWLGFWDSRPDGQKTALSCANGTRYRLQFNPEQPMPINFDQGGFWSVTVYNPVWFYNPAANKVSRSYRIHGREGGVIPADIYFAANCTGTDNCIEAPATGEFRAVLRFYMAKPEVLPGGGYPMPRIKKCGGSKNQGC
jgi:hypothetical protein